MRRVLIRFSEALDTVGFALIVASVVYFIIGTVAGVVHGNMLDWTFCGSAHYLFDVEWCGIEGTTAEPAFNHFIHRLMNVSLPWFGIFWGFLLVGISSVFLKILEYKYSDAER
jgi:hypothetical protein